MTRIPYSMAACCSLLLGIGGVLLPGVTRAQVGPEFFDFARPSLDWYTIETEHFHIVFHHDASGRGSSRTAQVVARIAEDVYEPITSLYDHQPDGKISFILKDFEDYSNGAAYFFDNKIEIWAPALDSPLRGDHNWLRNVITHEFTHMVQVQKAMKTARRLPYLYVQYLDYEDVKRPDVLYGYPDVIVTYPFVTVNNPAWLAEGAAQYQRSFLRYDAWDTHRDMLLRTRILAGEELSLAEMGGHYSHSSLMREGVYNQGFAFTHYLAQRYGEDVLAELTADLGKWRNWNVERAMEDATGDDADAIYEDWTGRLRQAYEEGTRAVREHLVEGRLVEEDGFSNFYPRFSPDGRRLAYVSNEGEDFNLMSLYVVDVDTGEELTFALGSATDGALPYVCSLGYEHRVRSGVGGAVSWHPDGSHVVYARAKTTREGFRYSDLYRLEVDSGDETRLTHGARAFSPAYHPDGSRIAYVDQSDGTSNLYVFEPKTNTTRALTHYEDGTQVTDPAWHPGGAWIYAAVSGAGTKARDIYRISVDGTRIEAVVGTAADERTPAFDADGSQLYFSSDRSGIFNVYRLGADGGGSPERLTNVLGGAFMPHLATDGTLAFARYDWDGYKIALLDTPAELAGPQLATYRPPEITSREEVPPLASARWSHVTSFDDTDLRPLGADVVSGVHTTGSYPLTGVSASLEEGAPAALEVEQYGSLFTSFSFFPVLRIDNYATGRERSITARGPDRSYAGGLWRNAKFGVYVSSREILEEMSLLGGLMVGPGSRAADGPGDFFAPSNLLKLERDAFLIVDYRRGFGILPRRWSPQLSIELYNIRRNVEGGLTVEEFPCTSCYPDTTRIDLSYSLWEADLYARSKLSESLLLEAGYRYSPYRVVTERFRSKEEDQFIPESASRYFIGRALTLGAYFHTEKPHRHSEVLPEEVRLEANYELESGRLLDRFDVEDGTLVPTYEHDRNHRLALDARVGVALPGTIGGAAHGVGFHARASTILGDEVDAFYNDYVGGLIGARGYPFYALGGNETWWLQAAYHFPILPDISKQVLFTYVDKLYGRLYADAAMGWSGAWPGLGEMRRDVGMELRLVLGSFYLMPTALFVSATYGLDAFDFQLDEGYLTPDGSTSVRYGNELLWHFGILFDFDL